MYEKFNNYFEKSERLPKNVGPFLAAFLGALSSNSIYFPFIVIRTRMQLNSVHYNYKNFFDGARQVLKKDGFRKLYSGGSAFFPQAALEAGLTFGFYELFSKAFEPLFPSKNEVNLPLSIASSASAASVTAIFLNPLDVVVARMQTMHSCPDGPCSAPEMIKRVYRKEGLRGFFKGVTGSIPHYAMSAAILFPTYEFLTDACKDKF